MSLFKFKSSTPLLSAQSIRALRKYTNKSIFELQRRASADEALLEFAILDNDWHESKQIIQELLASIEADLLPLRIFEHYQSAGASDEELLSPSQLGNRLDMIQEIAAEQDRAAQLEAGYIKTKEDY